VEALEARLATSVAYLLRRQQRVVVGIDGPDCAGKTTLGDRLAVEVGARAVRASIDGFHNPAHIRRERGDFSPEGYYRHGVSPSAGGPSLLDACGLPAGCTGGDDSASAHPRRRHVPLEDRR